MPHDVKKKLDFLVNEKITRRQICNYDLFIRITRTSQATSEITALFPHVSLRKNCMNSVNWLGHNYF